MTQNPLWQYTRPWLGSLGIIALWADLPAQAQTAPAPDLAPLPTTRPEPATTEATAAPSPSASFPTGDWGGLRTRLADEGYTFGGYLRVDTTRNISGGITDDKTDVRDLLDLNLTIDTEKAFGWHGGTFFFDFESHDGPNASQNLVGDAQMFDNQDGPSFDQIYQLWYQQRFLEDKFRLKVGKIDANVDFYAIDHATEFLSSSMSFTQTMLPLPTYPNPAPGGELFFEPDGHFYEGVGAFYNNSQQATLVFAGDPQQTQRAVGGAFLIEETGYRWKLSSAGLPGHAALGAWAHTGEFPELTGGSTQGNQGLYAFVDQSVWHVDAPDGSVRDLGVFLQGGLSDPAVNTMSQHIGAGLAATGLIPGRPSDIQGIGANWVQFGDQPGLVYPYELAIEAFYKLQLTPWLDIKPDLQYIQHPSGTGTPDAVVATIRLELTF